MSCCRNSCCRIVPVVGPAGPAGPAGPEGPAGPVGNTESDLLQLYNGGTQEDLLPDSTTNLKLGNLLYVEGDTISYINGTDDIPDHIDLKPGYYQISYEIEFATSTLPYSITAGVYDPDMVVIDQSASTATDKNNDATEELVNMLNNTFIYRVEYDVSLNVSIFIDEDTIIKVNRIQVNVHRLRDYIPPS